MSSEKTKPYDLDDPKRFIITRERSFNSFILLLFLLVSAVITAVGIADLAGFIKLKH